MPLATKPRWSPTQAVYAAREAAKLAAAHQQALAERLSPDIVEKLGTRANELEATLSERPAAQAATKGQTAAERTLSQEGLQLCSRLRDALRAKVPKGHPALKAAGVGMRTSAYKTASVLACLEAITAAAAAYPEVFTAARVLAADLAECTRVHEALAAAQNAQQGALLGTKDLTAAQKALQLELEGLVIDVSLAGKTVFRKDPVLFATFADLVPKQPRRNGGAKTPSPTPVGP